MAFLEYNNSHIHIYVQKNSSLWIAIITKFIVRFYPIPSAPVIAKVYVRLEFFSKSTGQQIVFFHLKL